MYGRTIHRAWLYCWLFACSLLQVARADFTQSDSDVLSDIGSDVSAIQRLVSLQQGDVAAIADSLGSLLLAWDNAIPAIKDDVAYLPYMASSLDSLESLLRFHLGSDTPGSTAVYATLQNIEASTEASANTLVSIFDNLVDTISNGVANAISAMPLAYASATNRVDLSIVSNLVVSATSLPFYTLWFPDVGVYFNEYLSDYFGTDSLDFDYAKAYYALSQMGFLNFLLVDALFPSRPKTSQFVGLDDNLFLYSYETWKYGSQDYTGFTDVQWPYTIFEAYNTLGISNILERANSEGGTVWNINRELSLLHTNFNNFAFVITNNVQSVADNVVNIKQSIGYNPEESGEEPLDYQANGQLPEWEPEYHTQVETWTNVYYYNHLFKAALDRVGSATDVVNSAFDKFESGDKDFHDKLTWSGVDLGTGLGQIGGWDLDVDVVADDADYDDVRNLTKQVFAFLIAVLDLAVVVYFSRRIFIYLMSTGMNSPGASS